MRQHQCLQCWRESGRMFCTVECKAAYAIIASLDAHDFSAMGRCNVCRRPMYCHSSGTRCMWEPGPNDVPIPGDIYGGKRCCGTAHPDRSPGR